MILRSEEIKTIKEAGDLVARLLKNVSYYAKAEDGVIKYFKRCFFKDVLYFIVGDNFVNVDGIIYQF